MTSLPVSLIVCDCATRNNKIWCYIFKLSFIVCSPTRALQRSRGCPPPQVQTFFLSQQMHRCVHMLLTLKTCSQSSNILWSWNSANTPSNPWDSHSIQHWKAWLRAVPEIIPGGAANTFLSGGGEGVLLTMCPRGGGWRGNLSWGSRHIWSIVGPVNESSYVSWGSGSSDSLCVLGVEGSEKKCGPPRIISGTALSSLGVYPTQSCKILWPSFSDSVLFDFFQAVDDIMRFAWFPKFSPMYVSEVNQFSALQSHSVCRFGLDALDPGSRTDTATLFWSTGPIGQGI